MRQITHVPMLSSQASMVSDRQTMLKGTIFLKLSPSLALEHHSSILTKQGLGFVFTMIDIMSKLVRKIKQTIYCKPFFFGKYLKNLT